MAPAQSQSRRWILLGLAGLSLSGCSAFEPPPLECPPIAILPDASRLVRYVGGTDLTDVAFEANIESVLPACQRSGEKLEVDLSLAITARRGPAMQGEAANFSYFVAVTAADQRLLARQEFPVSIPLSAQGRRVRLTEFVQPQLPLTETQSQFGYRLFIGFVLTRQEIQQNRGG